MEIESVEWSKYNLSFEGIIEAWTVAGDMLAVVSALLKVEAATEEDIAKLTRSLEQ